MKKIHVMAWPKLCSMLLLGASAMFMASCAQDGFDNNEAFYGTITSGDQLVSPDGGTFKVKSSADRSTQTISWNAATGALDYKVWIYKSDAVIDDANPGEVMVSDSLVHNPYVTVPRVRNTYYRIEVMSAENKAENNPGADTKTEYKWDTFLIEISVSNAEEYGGGDFYKFLKTKDVDGDDVITAAIKKNDNKVCPIYFFFKSDVSYNMSDVVDFGGYEVTLAAENEQVKPTIRMDVNACFVTYNTFVLENLKFDFEGCSNDFITLNKTPDAALLGATGGGSFYNIQSLISINNCEINKLKGSIIYDNNIKYCLETFSIDNCIFNFEIPTKGSGNGYIYMKGGFIKDLVITNSTFWNNGDDNHQYFIKYSNGGCAKDAGYGTETSQTATMDNNTFYNIAHGHWANWDGFMGGKKTQTEILAHKNIWQNCSLNQGGIIKRMLKQQDPSTNNFKKIEFGFNTYWAEGKLEAAATEIDKYDKSNTYIKTDPQLKNPAAGDFTVQGEEQLKEKTGDPRWLPAN